eukprot:TRINITY_DN124318_c0_g1_i1.p1 TRINITY_DN124318_c0_g1~~TRINITY_DN124318_c0_g1_i1.p1  ORF type:complete len:190 (+),score=28.51 TRINITY_DN124318_c0_g1_i1:74-643(+)
MATVAPFATMVKVREPPFYKKKHNWTAYQNHGFQKSDVTLHLSGVPPMSAVKVKEGVSDTAESFIQKKIYASFRKDLEERAEFLATAAASQRGEGSGESRRGSSSRRSGGGRSHRSKASSTSQLSSLAQESERLPMLQRTTSASALESSETRPLWASDGKWRQLEQGGPFAGVSRAGRVPNYTHQYVLV